MRKWGDWGAKYGTVSYVWESKRKMKEEKLKKKLKVFYTTESLHQSFLFFNLSEYFRV